MTDAGSTIEDQTVISVAATKGGTPLICWTKSMWNDKPSLAGIFAVWSSFYCSADNLLNYAPQYGAAGYQILDTNTPSKNTYIILVAYLNIQQHPNNAGIWADSLF